MTMASGLRPEVPSSVETLTAWIETYLEEVRTVLVGRVERYDVTSGTVDVQPVVRHATPNADGTTTYEDLPVIPAVPVAWPRAGAWALTLPLAAGDTGVILCCDASPGAWQAGDNTGLSYPGDLRRHHLAHALFYPGVYPDARAYASASPTDLVLGKDDGSKVVIKPDGTIELAGGAQLVALANLVIARLNELKAAIAAAATVTGDGGAAFKAAILTALTTWPGAVAAQKVRAT